MIKRGDIYFIRDTRQSIGSEQKADRPAVIVSNDANNKHSGVYEVVYMTTQPKTDLPTHFITSSALRTSTVLCEQISSVYEEEIDSLINAETWKNGKEWQEFFDIEVSEKSQATACKSEYFDKYNHLPDKLKEQPQQQINIDDLAERVAEKLKDATQPETPKVPENDVKQKTAEILEDLELI